MDGPYIRVEDSGLTLPLREDVTTIGRGKSVDVHLPDPSVSRLHAEIIRRGPYAYVTDLGLSRNGTRVNGRLVARRVLEEGDVLSFGTARCRVYGFVPEEFAAEVELRRPAAPELTRRELDVVTSLCRPALSDEAFVAPATAREIAADLVVTEAAVKQHLLRLYQKFRIPEGANRRVRLANEVVALGLVRPLPPAERALPPAERALPPAERAQPPAERAQSPTERVQSAAERVQPPADNVPPAADKSLAGVAPGQPAIPAQAAPAGAHGRRRTGGLRAATPN
jgi:FHA domain